MKTKTNHTATTRQTYQENYQTIIEMAGMDEDKYNNLWIDLGFEFLEHFYTSDAVFKTIISNISKDRGFWRWWLSEWKRHQSMYIGCISNQDINSYIQFMLVNMTCEVVQTGFYENYISQKRTDFFTK